MAMETVDALELDIRTRANDAAEKITSLADSVDSFGKKVSAHLADLKGLADVLERITNAMGSIGAVKNMKAVTKNIASAVKAAGAQIAGPVGQAADAAKRTGGWLTNKPATTVKGGTRLVRWGDGSTRRFNMTSDQIAKELMKEYELGGKPKEMSSTIQEIRNMIIGGREMEAVRAIKELAEDTAHTAGQARVSPFVQDLNKFLGNKKVAVTKSDLYGIGGSISNANSFLYQSGARFRLQKYAKEGTKNFDGQTSADTLENFGIHTPEGLIKAIADNTVNFNGHRQFMDENGGWREDDATAKIFGDLMEEIFGSEEVKQAGVDAAKEAVKDAVTNSKPSIEKQIEEAIGAGLSRSFVDNLVSQYKEGKLTELGLSRLLKANVDRHNAPPRTVSGTYSQIGGGGTDSPVEFKPINGRYGSLYGDPITEEVKKDVQAEIESLRSEFGGSSDKVKSVIANNHGMSVEEMFPKQEEISAAASEAEKLGDEMRTVADGAKDASKATEEVKKETEESDKQAKKLHFDLSNIKGALSGVKDSLKHGILGQLERITRMRALRYIVKSVASALKEGLDNLYQWSKMTNGHFAGSMDTAATKLMLIKNSVATALSPAIEALIPLLSTVAGWINTVANGMSQFFALLSGRNSWTKATEATQEWAAATKTGAKNAKDASKATKDLLADWDELNIIQSKDTDTGSGGGSGSGKKVPNYKDMFDEVYKFDGWIRDLVDGIKEQFGDIWGLAKRIGAVILGWKLSSVFTGALATLGSLIAAGGLIDLQFNLSTLFTNKFLDTGEEGWLIADVLTALMGGVLMNRVLKNVLGGRFAILGIPIMLTVSTMARTLTLLKRTDVSVLTPEALEANALSAIEMGGVAGYIAYAAGASMTKVISGAGAVALLTFGVLTGLKADVQAVKNNKLNKEYFTAKALESVAMIGGGAWLTKLIVPGVSAAQALGFASAASVATTLLTMGVVTGIVAEKAVAKSGKITEEEIIKVAASSVEMGIGSALAIKMGALGVHGLGWGITAAGGTGVTLFTFGAEMGIMATLKAAKNDEITAESIAEIAGSSIIMGSGVAIAANTIFGVAAGGAALAGGGFAVAAFAAMIAIAAILEPAATNAIRWGENKLTSEQIESFVNKDVFSINVPATVKLVKGTIEPLGDDAWKQIETDAAAMTSSLDVIKLGCASEDTYNNLKTALFGTDGNGGVIGNLKTYAKEQKQLLEVGFSLVPVLGEDGKTDKKATASALAQGQTGWDKVYAEMESVGNQLGKALQAGSDSSLENYDEKTIIKLTEKIDNIKRALQYSDMVGGTETNIMSELASMDKPTWEGIIGLYNKYTQELTHTFNELEKSKADSYFRLASYYDYLGDEESAKKYRDLGNQILANMDDAVKEAVKNASLPGVEALRKKLLEMLTGPLDSGDVHNGILAVGSKVWTGFMDELFGPESIEDIDKDAMQTRTKDVLNDIIQNAFPDDYQFIIAAIRAGVLRYGDIFTSAGMEEIIQSMGGKDPAFIGWFRDLLKNEFGIETTGTTEKPGEELEKVQEELQAQADENPVQIPVEVVYDGPDTDDRHMNPAIEAAQEWWDVYRQQGNTDEWLDSEESAFNTVADLFGDDIEALTELADKLIEAGDADMEDLPDDVLRQLMNGDEQLTVDASASGMATEATMKNLENVSHEDSTKISGSLPSIISVLGRIAESSQQAADKDFTVKVFPTAAWGRQAAKSGMMYDMLTGDHG